jgi:transcriptional regulator with XRE-family HTH domain
MSKIRSERIRLGLTQKQLAELLGVPFRTIQNWEGGQRKCPDYVERLILDKLGQPNYKAVLEGLIKALRFDLQYIDQADAKQYISNIVEGIEDIIKKEEL